MIWRIGAFAPYSLEIIFTGVQPVQEQMQSDSMAKSKGMGLRNRMISAAVLSRVLVAAGFLFSGFVSPDRLLERSYARVAPLGTIHLDEAVTDNERALHVTRTAHPAGYPAQSLPPALLIDGVPVETSVLSEPLAVGSRLRLAPGTIDAREIEVLEVAEMDAPVVGLPGVRLQLVNARALDAASRPETVRLIFAIRESDRAKVTPVADPTSGKVL